MRFSAAITSPPDVLGAPVARQPGLHDPADPNPPATATLPLAEVPADLDQRVRESGEW